MISFDIICILPEVLIQISISTFKKWIVDNISANSIKCSIHEMMTTITYRRLEFPMGIPVRFVITYSLFAFVLYAAAKRQFNAATILILPAPCSSLPSMFPLSGSILSPFYALIESNSIKRCFSVITRKRDRQTERERGNEEIIPGTRIVFRQSSPVRLH